MGDETAPRSGTIIRVVGLRKIAEAFEEFGIKPSGGQYIAPARLVPELVDPKVVYAPRHRERWRTGLQKKVR